MCVCVCVQLSLSVCALACACVHSSLPFSIMKVPRIELSSSGFTETAYNPGVIFPAEKIILFLDIASLIL